jgi:hypothetical protein
MVRRDLGRHTEPFVLRAAHEVDRASARQVAQVQAAAGHARDRQIARDGDLLGLAGTAGEAERGRREPFVHLSALDERRVLGVVGDHDLHAERLGVGEGVPQDPRRRHRVAVVAEHAHARVDHLAHLGERLTGESFRDRADREHLTQSRRRREIADLVDDRGVIGHRLGVRHRGDGGVPTERRGARAGLDRLLVLEAGFAQVRVQVDEPRRHHRAVAVDHVRP